MDGERNWRKAWKPPPWCKTCGHGLLAFSDGGYRGPGRATIDRIIFYVGHLNGDILIEPMAAETCFIHVGINDSFLAEVIALDTCIDHIDRYIRSHRVGA